MVSYAQQPGVVCALASAADTGLWHVWSGVSLMSVCAVLLRITGTAAA